MEMAFDLKLNKLGVLLDSTLATPFQIPAHNMSARQRQNIIERNVINICPFGSPALADYLQHSTTNRVKEYTYYHEAQIKGKEPLDIVQLRTLLFEVEKERKWRVR